MTESEKLKCKCGGDLKAEKQDESIEGPEHVIGRCVDCGKPWYFSIPMWEIFNGELNKDAGQRSRTTD